MEPSEIKSSGLSPSTALKSSATDDQHSGQKNSDDEAALKSSALKVLGYGFDRVRGAGKLSAKLEVTAADIDVSNEVFIKANVVNESATTAAKVLTQHLHFKAVVPEAWFLDGKLDARGYLSAYTGEKTVTATFIGAKVARCSLRSVPPFLVDCNSVDVDAGDSFIRSVQLYVGYALSFRIALQRGHQVSNSDSAVTVRALPGFQAYLNVSGRELAEETTGYATAKVTLKFCGFGGFDYALPTANVSTLEMAWDILKSIEADFAQSLPSLVRRAYDVDPSPQIGDLMSYDAVKVKGPSLDIPELPPNSLLITAKTPLFALRKGHQPQALNDLAKNVLSGMQSSERAVFTNIKDFDFQWMLGRMQQVFTDMKEELAHDVDKRSVYVIGMTGAGKSALIGYLLGHKLIAKQVETVSENKIDILSFLPGAEPETKRVLEYANECNPQDRRPEIGHELAKTKGCHIYKSSASEFAFVDCAGFFDTSGVEDELCNGMAITCMLEKSPPDAIIMVVSSNLFTQDRASGFIALVRRLRAAFLSMNGTVFWRSLIWVVNDKRKGADSLGSATDRKKSLVGELATFVRLNAKDCNKYFNDEKKHPIVQELLTIMVQNLQSASAGAETDKGNSSSAMRKRREELLNDLAKSNGNIEKLQERIREIEVLVMLLSHTENLVVVDLENAERSHEVSELLSRPGRVALVRGSFTIDSMLKVESSKLVSRTILLAIASYLSSKYSTGLELTNKIQAVHEAIKNIQSAMSDLTRRKEIAQSSHTIPNDFYQKDLDAIQTELGQEGVIVEGAFSNDSGKYKQLHEMERNVKSIQDRIIDLQTSSKTELLIRPNGNNVYKQKFCGLEENKYTSIRLLVEAKYDSNGPSVARVRENDLAMPIASYNTSADTIKRVNTSIERLKGRKDNNQSMTSMTGMQKKDFEKQCMKLMEDRQKRLDELHGELDKLLPLNAATAHELESYKVFGGVVAFAITSLNLGPSCSNLERLVLATFVQQFLPHV